MSVKAVPISSNMGQDADSNAIQPGLYTVNYKDKTYKEGGTFGNVEKVLAATIFCNYEKEAGTLKEVRAATGTKNKQEYYVELLKFDFGTAAVFYTKDHWRADYPNETDLAALKYRAQCQIYSDIAKAKPVFRKTAQTGHGAVFSRHSRHTAYFL